MYVQYVQYIYVVVKTAIPKTEAEEVFKTRYLRLPILFCTSDIFRRIFIIH